MHRLVEAELLDTLPPADPRAVRSRADLRRLNFMMGHARILWLALRRHFDGALARSRPIRLLELGAGDGTLLLGVARRWPAWGGTAQVTFLDRQSLVSAETRRRFAALHWSVESVAADVFASLEQWPSAVDVMFANLFLHHFSNQRLETLLRLAAAKTNLFIACEPRRSPFALTASRLLRLIGCNAITRHDAAVSVRAGFAGRELSALWPSDTEWDSSEDRVGLFSHCFVASSHA